MNIEVKFHDRKAIELKICVNDNPCAITEVDRGIRNMTLLMNKEEIRELYKKIYTFVKTNNI